MFRRAPVAAGQARAERQSGPHHFLAYSLVSTLLTGLLITHAVNTRQQFYPAVIYLVTSKMSILILGNMGECIAVASTSQDGPVCVSLWGSLPISGV
jgi:hypothetical protein